MKWFTLVLCFSLFFLAGIFVAHYQLFPYPQIKQIKRYFMPVESAAVRPDSHYYVRKISQHKLQKGQQLDALFVGDSLMDEADWGVYFPEHRVANFGINADSSYGLLKRVDVIADVNSEKLFLMIGINDIFLRHNMSSVQDNYRQIIEGLQKEGSKIYLLSCLYLGAAHSEYQSKIKELNQFIESTAREHAAITYIDLNPLLAPEGVLNPAYTNDGIHLNSQAYQQLSQAIAPYINE